MAKKKSSKNKAALPAPEFSKQMLAFRSASTTQPHDSRPNRQRSRHAAKRAAVRDGGW